MADEDKVGSRSMDGKALNNIASLGDSAHRKRFGALLNHEAPHNAHRPISALVLVNNGDLLRGLLVLHHCETGRERGREREGERENV